MSHDEGQPYRTHLTFQLDGTGNAPPSSIIVDAMIALNFSDERIKKIAPALETMAKSIADGTARGKLRDKLMPLAGVTEANVQTLVEAVKTRATEITQQAVGSVPFER